MELYIINDPWPWYVTGPLIGLAAPILLLLGNKRFGISSTLQDICAACIPAFSEKIQFNSKANNWNLFFITGIFIGGIIAGLFLDNPNPVVIADATRNHLAEKGLADFTGLVPTEIFNWKNLLTFQGCFYMIFGGFMVGFGTRYAGGCTSGHGIFGLATFQKGSLIAVVGFFIGGLFMLNVIVPLLFK